MWRQEREKGNKPLSKLLLLLLLLLLRPLELHVTPLSGLFSVALTLNSLFPLRPRNSVSTVARAAPEYSAITVLKGKGRGGGERNKVTKGRQGEWNRDGVLSA